MTSSVLTVFVVVHDSQPPRSVELTSNVGVWNLQPLNRIHVLPAQGKQGQFLQLSGRAWSSCLALLDDACLNKLFLNSF